MQKGYREETRWEGAKEHLGGGERVGTMQMFPVIFFPQWGKGTNRWIFSNSWCFCKNQFWQAGWQLVGEGERQTTCPHGCHSPREAEADKAELGGDTLSGQWSKSDVSLNWSPLYCLGQGLSLNPELTDSARLASRWSPGLLLVLPSQC